MILWTPVSKQVQLDVPSESLQSEVASMKRELFKLDSTEMSRVDRGAIARYTIPTATR